MANVKIGILGTGYMATKAYVPAFRRLSSNVYALCGRNLEKTKRLAEENNIHYFYDDAFDLVSNPELDAVIVATPNSLHLRQLKLAVAAGKHVLCEKPIGMNMTEAREMVEIANEAKVFHAVPYIWRLTDHAKAIKELIDKEYLGKAYELHAVFSAGFLASPKLSMGWRGKRDLAGEGVLADLGGHLYDLARWYFGEVKEVAAQGTTHIPIRQLQNGQTETVDVIDSSNCLVVFENGAQGSFQTSFVNLSRNMFIRVELHGSQGAILYDLEMKKNMLHTRLSYKRLNDDSELVWEENTQSFSSIIDRLCADFIQGVNGIKTSIPDLHDGYRGQAFIEAASRSLHSRKWEPLEDRFVNDNISSRTSTNNLESSGNGSYSDF